MKTNLKWILESKDYAQIRMRIKTFEKELKEIYRAEQKNNFQKPYLRAILEEILGK